MSSCGLGVLLFRENHQSHLGCEQTIQVWVRETPHWSLSMDLGNKDMSLLTAYLLNTDWKGTIRVVCVVAEEESVAPATRYLNQLLKSARMPDVEVSVPVGSFQEIVKSAPSADLNIFGFGAPASLGFVRGIMEEINTTCVFTRDSGRENVLA